MANTTEDDWDENAPVLTDPRRDGALEILSLRQAVGKRVAKEHVDPDAAGVGGEHLEGSARGYYEDSAPANRPDGTTALDVDDQGRIWADSNDTDRKLFMWTGSAWEEISKQAAVPFTQDDIEHDATPVDIVVAFKTATGHINTEAKAQLVMWSFSMKQGVGGAIPDVEYKKNGGGAFVALVTSGRTGDITGDNSIHANFGSFILNPSDAIRLSFTAGFTFVDSSANKVLFLV